MPLKILIADDHDMVRETIVMFLDADGATVSRAASTLQEALQMIETEARLTWFFLTTPCPA